MAAADPLARHLLLRAMRREPTLGEGRLVCLDGPGGSGKTTLAAALAHANAPGTPIVHLDDLYDGWAGLDTVAEQLGTLLGPLARGRPGRYRRYDWHARRYAESVVVEPADLLVLEGVGSGSRSVTGLCTLLVWVEAPRQLCRARGLARDGDAMAQQWQRWQEREAAHFAREGTRDRADVLVDGGGAGPVLLDDRSARCGGRRG